ncbi:MAG TPA: prepilin-type N-terminal cleavage/methylation domain-containing protein [Usitatibacteraceae bacterium]|jgi:general secretion pathway protein I|nr:prepilin-type N-terminal cleavage/methylation domain-containing protein [Usitatibacteraceae bacterium]HQY45584.1 prepilin-type N-terminal cleavage/methylation domain-containing protein [Usitatibacteraceae bacterium]HRA22040.1 prepilin-type N-terminal cleavage/methylation domain-containing protein [Usitatibacteraceae bacterium]
MRPTCLARPERGFTLLEVLAAFVVFALTMASLMQVFGGGLRDAQLADEYARAVMIAQSRLAEATATEALKEATASGTEGPFAWEVATTAYDERLEDPAADRNRDLNLRVRLLRIDSRVAWRAADGRDRAVNLATLALASKP